MSEERNQAPTRRRREMARARGMVARSGDLTAAVGVLAAMVLVGAWGGSVVGGLVELVRRSMEAGAAVGEGPRRVMEGLTEVLVVGVVVPVGGILGGTVVAMAAAHGLQTGGLWAPGLVAPDVSRLWGGSRAGWGRGVFGVLRTAVLVGVAGLMLRADWAGLARLSRLDAEGMLGASGMLARGFGSAMGLALIGLGVVDFVRQYRGLESRLRMTDQESREERKSEDGDPALRARRVRLARSWLSGSGEALKGAAVVLTGPGGLAVAVGGGPPPKPVQVRQVARGASAMALRRAAEKKGVVVVEAAEVSRRLARGERLSREMGEALKGMWAVREEGTAEV